MATITTIAAWQPSPNGIMRWMNYTDMGPWGGVAASGGRGFWDSLPQPFLKAMASIHKSPQNFVSNFLGVLQWDDWAVVMGIGVDEFGGGDGGGD
jgi:hypothetical protein